VLKRPRAPQDFWGNVNIHTIKFQTLRHELELLYMKESQITKDYYYYKKNLKKSQSNKGICEKNILYKKFIKIILNSNLHKYDIIATIYNKSNIWLLCGWQN